MIERSLLLGKPLSTYLALPEPDESAEEALAANPLSLENVERSHILKALRDAAGNKTAASRILGVSRKTVERKLKEWGGTSTTTTAVAEHGRAGEPHATGLP